MTWPTTDSFLNILPSVIAFYTLQNFIYMKVWIAHQIVGRKEWMSDTLYTMYYKAKANIG